MTAPIVWGEANSATTAGSVSWATTPSGKGDWSGGGGYSSYSNNKQSKQQDYWSSNGGGGGWKKDRYWNEGSWSGYNQRLATRNLT